MQILIGADPELFVKQNDRFVSGHGMVKGDKANPFKVKNGAVQVDGMALEFNIDPAHSKSTFLYNINSVMRQLASMVDGELVPSPVAEFTKEYIATQPKEATELGCDPDFDAWNEGRVNNKPDGNRSFRTGAGHIHIGWCDGADTQSPNHLRDCMRIVKQLDATLGIGSLLLEPPNKRREMYGCAGAFRPKSYGVEYRVLSNFWLKNDKLIGWVYDTTIMAIENLMSGGCLFNDTVPTTIKNGNIAEARVLANQYNLFPQGAL